MILAAVLLAAALSGQALALPPTPSKEAPAARADLSRCLAQQTARIERLEENLESVSRLAVGECDPQLKIYLHALGAPTLGDFTARISAMQSQIKRDTDATLKGEPRPAAPPKAFDIPNISETVSVTQALTMEASHDAIAAREARLAGGR